MFGGGEGCLLAAEEDNDKSGYIYIFFFVNEIKREIKFSERGEGKAERKQNEQRRRK